MHVSKMLLFARLACVRPVCYRYKVLTFMEHLLPALCLRCSVQMISFNPFGYLLGPVGMMKFLILVLRIPILLRFCENCSIPSLVVQMAGGHVRLSKHIETL